MEKRSFDVKQKYFTKYSQSFFIMRHGSIDMN